MTSNPYIAVEAIRASVAKQYELKRALALGWWHGHTAKEKGSLVDRVAFNGICVVAVVFSVWMASR